MIYINEEYLSDECLNMICDELGDEVLDSDPFEETEEMKEAFEIANRKIKTIIIMNRKMPGQPINGIETLEKAILNLKEKNKTQFQN